MINHRITIIRMRKPAKDDVNADLLWLADSLGITSARDKDRSCYRIFVELIKAPRRGMTSDEIAYHLDLTRGTVVHHLNRLMETGVVIPQKNRYYLRVSNLTELMGEIERDLTSSLSEMKRIAEKLDREIGL